MEQTLIEPKIVTVDEEGEIGIQLYVGGARHWLKPEKAEALRDALTAVLEKGEG